MGSTTEGAVPAAQEARATDPGEAAHRSFFARLFASFAPAEPTPAAQPAPQGSVQQPAPSLPGVGNLRRLRVNDVAVPKVEIVAVSSDVTREDLVAAFREHGFSRLPVYKGTLDKPLGLVMLKDFALTYGFGAAAGKFNLRKLIRPVLYAPPSMPLAVLLQKMQAERVHMALVIDEYGGVDGLLTIEDLLETVVGDISDEHDTEENALWSEEKPGVYIAQATAPLEEFERALGRSLRAPEDDDEIDTLGGLLFLRLGRVPARGELVSHEAGVEFEVIDADPRRIKKLRIRVGAGSSAGAPAAEVGA